MQRDHREIIPAATTLRNLKAEAELVNLSPGERDTSHTCSYNMYMYMLQLYMYVDQVPLMN